jgi:hypothetical protein
MKGAFIMCHVKKLIVVFAVALLVLAPRTARADAYAQLMIFTFSRPVAIPGVVLPAGTYQFKLADPSTSRNVVQILSNDGSQVYATLQTLPARRLTATNDPVVTFDERATGSPDAIRTIFYPGETIGMKLMYPEDQEVGEARVVHGTLR